MTPAEHVRAEWASRRARMVPRHTVLVDVDEMGVERSKRGASSRAALAFWGLVAVIVVALIGASL